MAGAGKKWLIGCGAGCGLAIILSILFTVGAGVIFMRPMNHAVDSQTALEEETGPMEAFRPGVDSLRPERLEAFLRVRAEVVEHCGKIEEVAAGFAAMDEVDGKEDPGVGEVLSGLGKVMGSVKGMVTELGAVLETRNDALIAEDMGLGEYTWIYVLSYYSYLGRIPETGVEDEGGAMDTRDRRLMRRFMERHAVALEEAGRAEEAVVWKEGADNLDREESGVPFAGSELPASVRAALDPYYELLELTFCPPLAEMDLGEIEKKGFSFRAD